MSQSNVAIKKNVFIQYKKEICMYGNRDRERNSEAFSSHLSTNPPKVTGLKPCSKHPALDLSKTLLPARRQS